MKGMGLATLIALACVQARAWTLNEVSVLIPLPTRAEFANTLRPSDVGRGGPLLPRGVYGELPRLILGGNPELIYTEQLRVVALRIDPCFHEGAAPLACRRQLRLVWQPLEFAKQGTTASALDAAVHSFHDFDDDDAWREFLNEWRQVVRTPTRQAAAPLGIHPVLQKEGLNGATWTKLRALILRHVGEENLRRATGMNVDPLGSMWVFAGIDVESGVYRRLRVPRVDRGAQGFFIDPTKLQEFRASLNPYPENQIAWLNLLNDSERFEPARDRDALLEALTQAARIENPRLENTGGIDCVSCHVAQTVRMWGERRGLAQALRTELSEFTYPDTAPSADAGTGFVNRLRAFGYFLDETNISRRTLNESLEVVRQLNAAETR